MHRYIVLIPVSEFRYFDKMMTFLYSLVSSHPFSVQDGGEWERQDLIYISFSRRHKNSAAITSFVPPSVVAGTTDPCGSRTAGGTVVTSSSFSFILHFSLIKGNAHLLVADAIIFYSAMIEKSKFATLTNQIYLIYEWDCTIKYNM